MGEEVVPCREKKSPSSASKPGFLKRKTLKPSVEDQFVLVISSTDSRMK